MQQVRSVVFERQPRQPADVVLLADQQHQGHREHVAQRPEARGPLGLRQTGHCHADPERPDRQRPERHPEERPAQDRRVVDASEQRRQHDPEGRVKEELGCQDLGRRRRAERLGE